MFCQVCRAYNAEDEEYCRRCNQKLLILSGGASAREEAMAELEEEFSFDEHLLERISILEEALRRATETLDHLFTVVQNQQETLAVTEAGLAAVRELMERKSLVTAEEWDSIWERHRRVRLLALEKREEFQRQRSVITALHKGRQGEELERCLDEAEFAFSVLDLAQAVEALERAFRLDRDNWELARFVGETLFNTGDTERALPYFLRVLQQKPQDFEGLVYSGVVYHEIGQSAAARDRLERACELYPDSFLPFFSLGAVLAAEGEPEQAREFLDRAVMLDAAPQALYLLGRCCHELGASQEAIRHLESAVARSPHFEEAHYQLGLVYLERRWKRKALRAFREAQHLNPRKFHYRELVRYLSEGESGSPFPTLDGDAQEAMARGEVALASDDPETAYHSFRQALQQSPEHPTLLVYFALSCLALDRSQEVEPIVRRVVALEPVGEHLRATAYAVWMEALRAEGRLREGNKVGRRMLAESSSNLAKTIAYYEMAWNLAELEQDLDEALEYARRARELAPEELRPFPLAVLGWVHYKRDEFGEAVECLEQACAQAPSGAILTQLGMALLASGDEERARDVLDRARSLRSRGSGVEFAVMECLRDSDRFHARLREQAAPRPR